MQTVISPYASLGSPISLALLVERVHDDSFAGEHFASKTLQCHRYTLGQRRLEMI